MPQRLRTAVCEASVSSEHWWTAVNTPTCFAATGSACLAYRSLGEGPPIILCTRFRGTLESCDPAFLDALSRRFRVLIFDYPGTGWSTGDATYDPRALAIVVAAFADALDLNQYTVCSWSLGGRVAQIVVATWPERITQVVLLGTSPIGKVRHAAEPPFSAHALKREIDLDDEIVLFFEPTSAESREAARVSKLRRGLRTSERSPDAPARSLHSIA